MWGGGWAPFSLFSLTLLQPLLLWCLPSPPKPHHLLWQNGSCVPLYTQLNSNQTFRGSQFSSLRRCELEKNSFVINRWRVLDWLGALGTIRVQEKLLFSPFSLEMLRWKASLHFEKMSQLSFHCVQESIISKRYPVSHGTECLRYNVNNVNNAFSQCSKKKKTIFKKKLHSSILITTKLQSLSTANQSFSFLQSIKDLIHFILVKIHLNTICLIFNTA